MKWHVLIGNIGQWVGMIVVLVGILVLTDRQTDPGGLCIASGSFIFAIGTKAKHELKGRNNGN